MIGSCKHCGGNGFIRDTYEPLLGDGTEKKEGIYHKFWVSRTDGTSTEGEKHHGCEYFVLDWKHDKFAPVAARAYAAACREEYPELAADLERLAEKYG